MQNFINKLHICLSLPAILAKSKKCGEWAYLFATNVKNNKNCWTSLV